MPNLIPEDCLSVSSLALIGFLLFVYAVRTWLIRYRALPLPPGPRRLPFVGSVGKTPQKHPWIKYREWSDQYGSDVVYAEFFGQGLVVLNSSNATTELLEKRSAIYSDRPAMPMLDLMGWGWDFANMPYGDFWRRHRRIFHQYFNSNAVVDHRPLQRAQIKVLLRKLMRSPEDFSDHIRHYSGSIILYLTYGYKMQEEGSDYYVRLVAHALESILAAANPGTYLVDFIPQLKYLPSWLPGTGYRKAAVESVPLVSEMRDAPFDAAKKAIKQGDIVPCFTSINLDKLSSGDAPPDQEEVIRNAAAVAYGTGSDTTVAALKSFILAMVLHPGAQRRAQEELDSVVGADRLPTFEDRPSLPYIDCILRETVRWAPVVPLSIAHRVLEDDIYSGYRIPKGATVLPNVWAILYDENEYKYPSLFRPERFLKHDGQEPEKDPFNVGVFGFGRRLCPGRHLADGTMWIAVASILSVFDISKSAGPDGNKIDPVIDYTTGLVSHPHPFQCSIKLRSKRAQSLVEKPIGA